MLYVVLITLLSLIDYHHYHCRCMIKVCSFVVMQLNVTTTPAEIN